MKKTLYHNEKTLALIIPLISLKFQSVLKVLHCDIQKITIIIGPTLMRLVKTTRPASADRTARRQFHVLANQ